MDVALGWLGDIVRALMSLIPCLMVVRPTHAGVRFRAGSIVKLVSSSNGLFKTGLHIYWPVVTEIETVPIKRQTLNLVPQYLVTKDGKTVGVSGIVVYEVVDVIKILTDCWDHDDTIKDHALAAIKIVVSENDFQFFQEKPVEADRALTRQLRNDLRRFGVKTIRVTLSDFTQCFVLANLG